MDPAFSQAFQRIREAKLLTCKDLMLLMLTNQRKGGWVLADLVKLSGFSAPTIGMAKNTLVDENLVAEHLPFRDRRTVKIYLTEGGHEKAAELWKAIRDLVGIERSYRSSNPPA